MATKEKRVLLFLVEGISDKVSLQSIFEDYFDSKKVQISVMRYDITQEENPAEIKSKLNQIIQGFCSIEKIKVGDIKKIIHIVDNDGAFVNQEYVLQNDGTSKTSYSEEFINAKKRESIIQRNNNKASVLNILSKISTITVTSGTTNIAVPYSIYYFSRNLEHVLHNIIGNLTDQQKEDYSNNFDDEYEGDSKKFKSFISNSEFAVPGNYKNTWDFIKQDTNSLKRFSNIHLIFEDIL